MPVRTPATIPAADHERFPHAPVKVMLGQVRFPAILSIEEARFIASFQESIRQRFPDVSPEQQLALEVTDQGAIEGETAKQWRFRSSDGAWSVVLATEFLTLEATANQYTGYDDFRGRFTEVWMPFLELIRPSRVTQQGLRYVNHISRAIEVTNWQTYINPELLGPIASATFASEIETAFSDIRLRRDDGTLSIKHGLVPAGPTRQLAYVLDFDYFIQELDSDGSVEELAGRFDAYHEAIYGLFIWCLTDRTLDELREIDEAAQ